MATGRGRAGDLVPLAHAWRPDLVVHEEMDLAGAVAAAVTGARHVVHGLGLLPPGWVWQLFAPVVTDLVRASGPRRSFDPAAATYLRVSPPSLQPDASVGWDDVRLVRAGFGAPSPLDRLPRGLDDFVREHDDPVVHLTLGTVFHETPGVLATAVEGLRDLSIRLVVTTGPGVEPASSARSRPTCASSATSRMACSCATATSSSPTPGPASCSPPSPTACRSCCYRRAPTSSTTPMPAATLASPSRSHPTRSRPARSAMSVRRLLVSPSFCANTSRVRRDMAAMPSPGEVLAGLMADAAAAA